jgi:hypothetical protein
MRRRRGRTVPVGIGQGRAAKPNAAMSSVAPPPTMSTSQALPISASRPEISEPNGATTRNT